MRFASTPAALGVLFCLTSAACVAPNGPDLDAGSDGGAWWSVTGCPAGSAPRFGATSCQSVGWTTCPAGFGPARSGWGCEAALPDAPCTGATLETLGSAACQPVGDCGAAFPPANATHVVDAAFTSGQLDATHFKTIGAALAAAPAGAVVAVQAGQYFEALSFTRSVTVVGRCAAQVRVSGTGANLPGLGVRAKVVVEVKGLTVTNHYAGAFVQSRGALHLFDSVLESNRSLGALVAEAGSELVLTHSVIRDTQVNPDGTMGRGVDVEAGARARLVDSSVSGNRDLAVFGSGAGTSLELSGTFVGDMAENGKSSGGVGLHALDGAHLSADRVVVRRARTLGVWLKGDGTTAALSNLVVADTLRASAGPAPRGLEAGLGARGSLTDALFVRNQDTGVFAGSDGTTLSLERVVIADTVAPPDGQLGLGLQATRGALVELRGSAIIGAPGCGLAAVYPGTTVSAWDSLVADTTAATNGFGLAAVNEARVHLTTSAVVNARTAGLFASLGSTLTLDRSLVSGTELQRADGQFGHGVVAIDVGTRVDLTQSAVVRSKGVALVYSSATGGVAASAVVGNAIGLQVQGSSALREAAAVPPVLGAGEVFISTDTAFLENAARTGVGLVPLPAIDSSGL